ncbi:hypothetical protein ACRC7T_01845 [Segnochrobactraceae bacterium EtOH-i3]
MLRSGFRVLSPVVLLLVSTPLALAQAVPAPSPKAPPAAGAASPFDTQALPAAATPYAPAVLPGTAAPDAREHALYLVAKLTEQGKPLNGGVIWRIYEPKLDAEGRLPLVATSTGGDAEFRLPPGTYLVNAAYGRANRTVSVTTSPQVQSETVVLNAGGLQLDANGIDDKVLPAEKISFDIFSQAPDEDVPPVLSGVPPHALAVLPAGTYHVVSRYGSANAVLRADLKVDAGKITEATLHHRAAEIVLKLVSAPGGEALADTAWSVLTPGGDAVVEGVGAFPSFVLAEGEYSVIARHRGETYSRVVTVKAGDDGDVEVVAATDRLDPDRGDTPTAPGQPMDAGPDAE